MRITVVHSHAPRQLWLRELDLDSGATVREALAASGLLDAFPTLDLGACTVAVWGQRAQPTQRLREGDRVEVCRPLKVDPKVARQDTAFSRVAEQDTRPRTWPDPIDAGYP